jgi:hypothetical protein
MNDTLKFSCEINTTKATCPLGLEIWADDQQIFNSDHVTDVVLIDHVLSLSEGEHSLKFVMKGKTAEHTKIDESGHIVSDARLTIKNLEFDEIALGHMFTEIAVYTHDFNGAGQSTQDKFYNEMGCNGTVEFKFSTPIYIWLLEIM